MATSSAYSRSPELASRDDSRLLVVDMQERLVPHIGDQAALVANVVKLVRGAQLLGVPVTATEQYAKGLGPTVEAIRPLLTDVREKLRFSSVESLEWGPSRSEEARHRIVVCGVEAHVCVQQTVIDLTSQGYRCYVPADAVGSRSDVDRRAALERMSAGGAVVTTVESMLFEWCETASAPEFKALSRLVTGRE